MARSQSLTCDLNALMAWLRTFVPMKASGDECRDDIDDMVDLLSHEEVAT